MLAKDRRKKLYTLTLVLVLLWLAFMFFTQNFHLFKDHWFMTVTMVAGSFIAGATSEGGGAVAFPVMTLLFKIPPATARDFSLMIQSFGMNMAGLTIFLLRVPFLTRIILPVSVGGAVGMILGLEFLSQLFIPAYVKMFFTSFWLSFAVALYLISQRSKKTQSLESIKLSHQRFFFFVLVGLLGGAVSSLIGSGIDIITFSLLTLAFNVSVKIATPTSVVLMGLNSLVGFLYKGVNPSQFLAPQAWNFLFVCIPVVIIGAPMGALFIRDRSKKFIEKLLIFSIVVQFLWSLFIIPQTVELMIFSLSTFTFGLIIFYLMKSYSRS